MNTTEALLELIPYSPNRVSMTTLSNYLGCTEREVREYVKTARIAGEIIGSDQRGYYLPIEADELARHYRMAYRRAISTHRTLKQERRFLRAMGVDVLKLEGRKKLKD